jgi:hypothetical protein
VGGEVSESTRAMEGASSLVEVHGVVRGRLSDRGESSHRALEAALELRDGNGQRWRFGEGQTRTHPFLALDRHADLAEHVRQDIREL